MTTISRLILSTAGALAVASAALGQPGAPPSPVVVTKIVERQAPASIRLVGTVLAWRESIVACEVSGIVAEFASAEGQFLRAGETICRLDPLPAQFRLGEARGTLDRLRARLAEYQNGTRPEEIKRAEAAVAETQAVVNKWEFERERLGQLARNTTAAKEMHDTEMELLAAKRRLTQDQALLELARNGVRAEQLDAARADVAAQDAVVRRLERELEKTRIAAPFDGYITAKRTELGQWIEAGGPAVEMVAVDTVKVRADAPESAISFATVGAPATLDVQSLTLTTPGSIARVIPRAAAARTFPIEVDVPNANHKLLPGMFVWVHVPAGPSAARLMVSPDAVVANGPEKRVFVIRPGQDGGTMAIPTPVATGLALGGEIEISGAGLAPGDQVVVRANERLFGPSPVQITDAAPASQPSSRP